MTVRRLLVSGPPLAGERSGPGVHLTELLRALVAERPELAVALRHNSARHPEIGPASAAAVHPSVRARTTRIPERAVRGLQASVGFPSERVLGGAYDVFHQFHTDADPAVPSRKLVVNLHDVVARRWPAEEGAMYVGAGSLLRRAAAVTTGSAASRDAICEAFGVPEERVHVTLYGVRAERFAEVSDAPVPDGPYLLHIGGHTPRKNLPRLIEAFAAVRTTPGFADLRLVLAGPSIRAEADLRRTAPTGLPSDALIFTGYVSDAEAVALYQRAAAFVFPSLAEGFGLPVLEAMAAGCPVVASSATSLPEVGGSIARYIDPESVASIADGIVDVLGMDTAAHAATVAAGRSHAATFTWERCARQTLAVYDGL
ncbi:hypothetical protein Back2_13800 [Nocardioides baekrokdamisoli]|uniref:Glycosyltransferase subfamily 4-like N-terminal domain-containing protein n=1 Tax=Nocardioides baekrokdamisoli TaxID=1804624 RepID=A0A3G9IXH4_9ACTN|nr:glycosyltransferase family 1 protein [Nocardioides baekrokdamisoli]BBH17093.1 hypothetical protein Back2_13800 [Nocardioides baekrokdamisoli]